MIKVDYFRGEKRKQERGEREREKGERRMRKE
jgi:hypothetical protein